MSKIKINTWGENYWEQHHGCSRLCANMKCLAFSRNQNNCAFCLQINSISDPQSDLFVLTVSYNNSFVVILETFHFLLFLWSWRNRLWLEAVYNLSSKLPQVVNHHRWKLFLQSTINGQRKWGHTNRKQEISWQLSDMRITILKIKMKVKLIMLMHGSAQECSSFWLSQLVCFCLSNVVFHVRSWAVPSRTDK